MYNLRIRNFFSLCTCARTSIFSYCHEVFASYLWTDVDENDLLIKGFSLLNYADVCRTLLKSYVKDFCFHCADDCGYNIQIEIERV